MVAVYQHKAEKLRKHSQCMGDVKLNGPWGVPKNVLLQTANDSRGRDYSSDRSRDLAMAHGTSSARMDTQVDGYSCECKQCGAASGRICSCQQGTRPGTPQTCPPNASSWVAPCDSSQTPEDKGKRVFYAKGSKKRPVTLCQVVIIAIIGIVAILTTTSVVRANSSSAWISINSDTLETPFRNLALLPTSSTQTYINTRQDASEYIRHVQDKTVEVLSSSLDFFFPHTEFVNVDDAKHVNSYHRRIVNARTAGSNPSGYANVAALDTIARFNETSGDLAGRVILSALDHGHLHEVAAFDTMHARLHSNTVTIAATKYKANSDYNPSSGTRLDIEQGQATFTVDADNVVAWTNQGADYAPGKGIIGSPGAFRIRTSDSLQAVNAEKSKRRASELVENAHIIQTDDGKLSVAGSTNGGVLEEHVELDQLVLGLVRLVQELQEAI